MEIAIRITEILLYISVLLFPVTSLVLIRTVKKQNLKLIKEAVKNPLISNISFRFFEDLRKEYLEITDCYWLVWVNKITQYLLIVGFSLLMVLVIINEFTRYY